MSYKPDGQVKYIVIHYSATAVEDDVSADDIDRMHKRLKDGGMQSGEARQKAIDAAKRIDRGQRRQKQ